LLPLCTRKNLDVEVLYFDLNGFKALNDRLGHRAGDDALKAFAKILLKGFRNSDVVARLGGDEFAVMMAGQRVFADKSLARMRTLAKDETSDFSKYLDWSVGRVKYDPNAHSNIEEFLSDADARMYADKARKNQGLA
jgi:diguanylate cyclase (GGDEF)-like protein